MVAIPCHDDRFVEGMSVRGSGVIVGITVPGREQGTPLAHGSDVTTAEVRGGSPHPQRVETPYLLCNLPLPSGMHARRCGGCTQSPRTKTETLPVSEFRSKHGMTSRVRRWGVHHGQVRQAVQDVGELRTDCMAGGFVSANERLHSISIEIL